MLENMQNNSLMDSLRDEIEAESKDISLLRRLLPYLPKILFYGFFTVFLLVIICLQFSILAKNSKSVLVELADGNTIQAEPQASNHRSPAVIRKHVSIILPMLMRISNKLPVELGGGIDQGMQVQGVDAKIPSAIALVSWNLTEDGRLDILNQIVRQFPPGLWQGEQKLLRIYDLSEPVKTETGYMVYMTASIYYANASGQPRYASTFNREIHLIPVLPFKAALKPSPVEKLVNGLNADGLMISYLKTREGEQ
jgi:hypothetical protein